MPEEVGQFDLWWDVSPLRPHEWDHELAGRFMRAKHIQDAYRDGMDDANAEKKAKGHG